MSPRTIRENEIKLEVPAAWRMPELSSLGTASKLPTRVLTNTYFDTTDLRLARAGITLRRRTGGADAGWHLKIPAHGDATARDEIQMPLSASRTGVPPALSAIVSGQVRGEALEEQAVLRTRRTVYTLTGPGRARIEISDDRVRVLGGPSAGAQWREVEVESQRAGDADRNHLNHIVTMLETTGATRSGSRSKAARALGVDLSKDRLAPSPGPRQPMTVLIESFLVQQTQIIVQQDLRERRGLPDAVHQIRVSARRMRSALRVLDPMLDPQWSRQLGEELAWLAGALGAARDAEVVRPRLLRSLRTLPREIDAAALLVLIEDHVRPSPEESASMTRSALSDPRYLALLDDLADVRHRLPLTPLADRTAGKALLPLLRKTWRHLDERVSPLSSEAAPADWHTARIAAKRMRYTAELASLALGKDAKRLASALSAITDLLGENQDCTVTASVLAALMRSSHARSDAAFALGMLYQQQQDESMALRAQLTATWATVSKPRLRTFMKG